MQVPKYCGCYAGSATDPLSPLVGKTTTAPYVDCSGADKPILKKVCPGMIS